MAIKLGNTDINIFGNNWVKAYLGNNLVLEGVPYFETLWETTGANETIQLPISNAYTWDWGDGTINTSTSHTYTDAGFYTIKTADVVTDFSFNNMGDRTKIKDVLNYGGLVIIANAFYGASSISALPTDIPTISSLRAVFRNDTFLTFNSSISLWDVSQIQSMTLFLINCNLFNEDLSPWDFSSCTLLTNFARATNMSTTNYDLLLNKWAFGDGGGGFGKLVFSQFTNVTIGMDTLQYTSAGAVAHADLVSQGFIIIDSGQV